MAIENQDAFAVHSEEAISGSFTIAAKNAGKERGHHAERI